MHKPWDSAEIRFALTYPEIYEGALGLGREGLLVCCGCSWRDEHFFAGQFVCGLATAATLHTNSLCVPASWSDHNFSTPVHMPQWARTAWATSYRTGCSLLVAA